MRAHVLRSEQRIAKPLPEVFEFFARAGNLERITPPLLRFQILHEPAEVTVGTLISYRLKVHHIPIKWVSRIDVFERDKVFVDRQLTGPYKLWVHRHTFEADSAGTTIRDEVHYQMPFGILGAMAHLLFVRRDLRKIFAYRHQAVEEFFAAR
jgi:ligand-binding SRPBCC domain-containing protein